jgi:hypothetical protein
MKEPKLYPRTYTIHMEPGPDGGLVVTVPEIGAVVEIESTRLDDAIDAAHAAIEKSVLKEYEEAVQTMAS